MKFSKYSVISLSLLVTLAILPALTSWAQDDTRISDLVKQIQEAEAVLPDFTNEVERVEWERRIDLLKKDLANAEQRRQLEEREKTLVQRRMRNSVYILREAVGAIDMEHAGYVEAAAQENKELFRMRTQRADLEDRRREYKDNADAAADITQDIRTLDENILRTTLDRDVAMMRARIAREARRIEEHVDNIPINPRPTIRLLISKNRYRESEAKQRDDLGTEINDRIEQREQIDSSLSLSRAKASQIDQEIELLQKQKKIIKARKKEVGKLLSNAKSEKKALGGRIEVQASQALLIEELIDVADQLEELYSYEVNYLEDDMATLVDRYYRSVLVPIVAIGGIIAFYVIVSLLFLPRFFKRDNLFVARRFGRYLVIVAIVFVLTLFFLEDLKQIATVMGIAGAALVIALQDLCSSIAGWFVIVLSRKFSVGDRVEIDGQRGDVIDIQLLRTTLVELNNWLGVDEPTGRVILVPNSFIFKSKVLNCAHVHPYIWGNVDITVTFETPAHEAEALLTRILEEETVDEFAEAATAAEEMEKRYGVSETAYRPKVYSIIADSGVLYRMIYVCHYTRFSGTRNKINRRIIKEFDADPKMEFAYPTERHIPTPEPGGFDVNVDKKA